MVATSNLTSLLGIVSISATSPKFTTILLELLQRIQSQSYFSTVVLLASAQELDIQQHLMNQLGVQVINLTPSVRYQLKQQFRDDILSVVYITPDSFQELVGTLAENLYRFAQTKIIFVCFGMRDIMTQLFSICWQKKMINTIALEGVTYFSYNPFPELEIQEHSIHENREMFPDRLLNVHKYPFRMIVDGVEPRDYVYINREGKQTLGGYTARFLSTFADKINATLTTPVDSGTRILYHQDTDEFFATDVIDIFGGLVILLPPLRGQSNPAEIVKLCVMLPVEAKIPQSFYFPIILTSYPILMLYSMIVVFSLLVWATLQIEGSVRLQISSLLLNEKCFRAILGQPFHVYPRSSMTLRAILFLNSALGLFFNVFYMANLNTLVTSAPTEPLVTRFEDLRRSHYKVFLYRSEYNEILRMTDEFEKFTDTFEFTDNHTYFHLQRNTLDTKFAYSVPTNKWKSFQEQQSYFPFPLFRISNLCLIPVMPMVFLLHENSIYLEPLNNLLVRTHQSGLYEHWVKMTFVELVEAKRMKMDIAPGKIGTDTLGIEDLVWLIGLFGVLVLIDCSVLAIEKLWHKAQRRWNA